MDTVNVMSFAPLLAILLPAVGAAFAVPLERRGARWRNRVLGALSLGSFMLTIALIPGALDAVPLQRPLLQLTPQVWLHLRVDALGALFAATVSLLFLLALAYAAAYLSPHGRLARYYGFLMLCQGLLLGVAYAGNLLTLLVFYELFSLLSYPLVIHDETPAAMRAGLKYIVYILVGGSAVLLGVVVSFYLAGDQPFAPGGMLDAGMDPALLRLAFWCFIGGFGVKAALVPLHGWVPDVHPAAPASFSALLSGVMVAAGSFGILRIVFEVFGVELVRALVVGPWLAGIASVSVLLAAILAVGEDDLKRRLAWSTISQMAYVLLAVSLLAPAVTVGALVHISHHAFLKGALFFCAGAFARHAGVRRVSELDGIGRRMPVTTAVFVIAAFGLVGVPPLAGFISKWSLGIGMLEAGAPWALVVLLGGALLAAMYLLPPAWRACFGVPSGERGDVPATAPARCEARGGMLFALLATAAISVLLGLAAALPGLPLSLARRAAGAFFGTG